MSFHNFFFKNKVTKIVCRICGKIIEVLPGETAFNKNNYICDLCKAKSEHPMRLESSSIITIEKWHETTTKCKYCDMPLWCHKFKIISDSEIIIDGGICIKPHNQEIEHWECGNPYCEYGWGKLESHKRMPAFLQPPWAIPPLKIIRND